MAEADASITQLEEDAKRIAGDYKARIAEQGGIASRLGTKLRTGYEFRKTKCEVTYDDPQPGKKTTRRLDTGDTTDVREMDDSEKQRVLEFMREQEKADGDGELLGKDRAAAPIVT